MGNQVVGEACDRRIGGGSALRLRGLLGFRLVLHESPLRSFDALCVGN